MRGNYFYIIRASVLGTITMLAVIFIPAGTLNYWQGWAFVLTFMISSQVYLMYLIKYDPALLKRRTEAGISHEKEPIQKVIIFFIYISFIALGILSPLDFRFGWSHVPWYISIFGDVLVAVSFYIFYLVSKVNTYAASNVSVEKGQKVISTGLYRYIRHPMYSGALILVMGVPLALGSWWGLIFMPLSLCILYFRITNEEKVLLRDLHGYREYCSKVRWRLIPGIY